MDLTCGDGEFPTQGRLQRARRHFDDRVELSEPFPGKPPLWIEPVERVLRSDTGAAVAWVAEHKEAIEDALMTFGAVVWRGFPVTGPDAFAAFMGSWPAYSKGYTAGSSDRRTIKGQVMEATRTPGFVDIPLHQEMSYLPDNPRLIAFYCHVPPAHGGQTVIGDMRGALEALPRSLQRRFLEHGVLYRRNLRNGDVEDWRSDPIYHHPSWRYWFDGSDPTEISERLRERGVDFEWLPDGSLRLMTHTAGVTAHPKTGERLLFNQLYTQCMSRLSVGDAFVDLMERAYGGQENWPFSVCFGDGSPLEDADYIAIREEMRRRRVAFDWRAADVMLLENKFTAHGRAPFEGPRDIQVMIFD
jgi:alpha-ketoglutarate-dependent taurine dioxygenase